MAVSFKRNFTVRNRAGRTLTITTGPKGEIIINAHGYAITDRDGESTRIVWTAPTDAVVFVAENQVLEDLAGQRVDLVV